MFQKPEKFRKLKIEKKIKSKIKFANSINNNDPFVICINAYKSSDDTFETNKEKLTE